MSNIIYELVDSPYGEPNLKGTLEDGTEIWIPQDPENSHYQAFLESLEQEPSA